MACRLRATLASVSSDRVPPELAVLGLRDVLLCSGQTGRHSRSDRSAQDLAGVDRFDNRSRVLAHPSVFGANLCQHTFWRLRWRHD